jgi:hypothetical protein
MIDSVLRTAMINALVTLSALSLIASEKQETIHNVASGLAMPVVI